MKVRHFPQLFGCFLAAFYILPSANGQFDSHYWTHQYGAKGLLLNGSVIAATEDETAVFYNPGAMGNGEDFGISLSFFTPQYTSLTTKGYLNPNSEARDSGFGFSSDLSAIGFRPFKDHRFRASITSFARYKSGLGLRERQVGHVLNEPDLLFTGNLDFRRSSSERWFGFGLAMKINENLSVGVSNFAAFRSENTRLSVRKEIVNQATPYELELGWRSDFKYSFSVRGGVLTKFGLSAKLGDLTLGLTATTPMYYQPFTSAGYESDDLRTFSQDSVRLISNRDAAELLNYKTPWSFGLGLDFRIDRTRISLSTEYFQKIDSYTIINDVSDPFNGLADGNNEMRTVIKQANRPVLNAGVGLQTIANERTTFITGFRTDFNQRKLTESFQSLNFLSTTPSVFHISFGVFSTFRSNKYSLGLDYAFGRKRTTGQLVDLTNITPENLFGFTDSGGIITRYRSVVLVFTYDFIMKSWKERKQWKASQG